MKFGLQIFKSKVKKIENEACLNCGQPFSGHEKFCSYCGQKNTNKKLTFGTFINNLVSGFFSYDSRFWSTFIPLLTKPGKVSKDYIEGKRARFVNPFQLYLNISIIFFLVLGISNRGNQGIIPFDEVVTASQSLDSLKQINQQQIDSIVKSTQEEVAKKAPNDSTSKKSDSLDFFNFKSINPLIYGSELFNQNNTGLSSNQNIATPLNYEIGPNDVLKLVVYGVQEYAEDITVSNEGRIQVQNVGPIKVAGLTIEAAIEKINETKANLLYKEIDTNPLFQGVANKEDRSHMNVTFTLTDESKKEQFDTMWKAAGISGINGHRSVGGYRASIYNAMPIESVQVLLDIMKAL